MIRPARGPLLPEIGILGMPYHTFGSHWLTPHHVLTRLASYFQVLWLEPPHPWREIRAQRARRSAMAKLVTAHPPSFGVHVPEPWLPLVYRPSWLGVALERARVRRAWRQLRRRGCRRFVLYLWHHQFESALEAGHHDLSLYHIDDEYSFTTEPPPMDPQERRVIGAVNQVFAISPGLMERKGGINPHTMFMPEGVDYRAYSTPVPEPKDLASIPHPRVGYTGTLKRQLDWPLLSALAHRHPEWSFVFVGPRALDGENAATLDAMARLPNVHLLGLKTVAELTAYPQHFDVCIMPYVVNGYTNNIYPLKLHEYLASGRPVVAAPIRSLQEFREMMALPGTVDEWSGALTAALAAPAAREAAAARKAVAQEYDWSELVHKIAQTICGRLDAAGAATVPKLALDTPSFVS